jgi:hypothetical protein
MTATIGRGCFYYWKQDCRRQKGCNHVERVRIERFLAAGASIKGAARKFAIDYHALRRHWRNHVSVEARAGYIVGAGATKDQLEEILADESLLYLHDFRFQAGDERHDFTAFRLRHFKRVERDR